MWNWMKVLTDGNEAMGLSSDLFGFEAFPNEW